MSDLTTINAPTYNIAQFELLPYNATMTNLMAHYWITLSQAQIDMPSGNNTEERATILFINKSNHDLDAALNIANVEAADLREDLISDNFDVFAREQDHDDPDWSDQTYDELLYNSDEWAEKIDSLEDLRNQIRDGYNYIGVVDTDYRYIGTDLHELFATVVYNWGHNISMIDNPPRIDAGYTSVDGSKRG